MSEADFPPAEIQAAYEALAEVYPADHARLMTDRLARLSGRTGPNGLRQAVRLHLMAYHPGRGN